jgi:nondiscriminating glutamyl-tRNA synthetase
MRLALLTAMWAWSRKATLVATNDMPDALDDLRWLGVEPDETVQTEGKSHLKRLVDELLEADKAYPCYCSSAELREMPAAPQGSPEEIIYDGRCRQLSEEDQKALAKAGRKPSVRLRTPDNPADVLPKRLHDHLPRRIGDFLIFIDGNPTTALSAAVDDTAGSTTHTLLQQADSLRIHQRALLANALGGSCPDLSFVTNGKQIVGSGSSARGWTTIGNLRDAGYLPSAVRQMLLESTLKVTSVGDLKKLSKNFKLASLNKQVADLNLDSLQTANTDALKSLPEKERVEAVVAHLERRGFTFRDRDLRWKKKFVATLVEDLSTLSDAERMAALVLTDTVDYERAIAEVLREKRNQQLITTFEKSIKKGKTSSLNDWKAVLARFRTTVDVPGRALMIVRMVLTGERRGPNLAQLLTLLGEDGCRIRLKKARKYKS